MIIHLITFIQGIGPKKAFELIKKHKNIETILENIDQKKYSPPENWLYKEARHLFAEPEVFHDIKPLKWPGPNVEECVKFLHEEKGFNEERVRTALKRMDKAKGKLSIFKFKSFPMSLISD